jgi:hypothetical protein
MKLSEITREMFNSRPVTGRIIAGVQWVIKTDLGTESHETYQFSDVAGVIDHARALSMKPGIDCIRIVTHAGDYEEMRQVWKWYKPQRPLADRVADAVAGLWWIRESCGGPFNTAAKFLALRDVIKTVLDSEVA